MEINEQYNSQLIERKHRFEPINFELKEILLAVSFFFLLGLLCLAFSVSTWNDYSLEKTIVAFSKFKMLSLKKSFAILYLAPIAAILMRFFSLGKSVKLSMFCIFLWLIYMFNILSPESFGYTLFWGVPMALIWLLLGLLAGYWSRYFRI